MSAIFIPTDDQTQNKRDQKDYQCIPSVAVNASLFQERPPSQFQHSLPTLTPQKFSAFTKSPVSPTSKMHFKDLPADILPVKAHNLDQFLTSENGNVTIIDSRPFTLFSSSRVANAINLCVPSTLLKRESYSLVQVLGSIDPWKRSHIIDSSTTTSVLIYDSDSNQDHISFPLYQTCLKFYRYPNKKFKVYYLNGGFSEVITSSLIETQFPGGDSKTSSHNPNSIESISPISPSNPSSTMNLSGFLLPSSAPAQQKFLSSIKRNALPKLDLSSISGKRFKELAEDEMRNYDYKFKFPAGLSEANLPQWLQFLADIANSDSSDKNKDVLNVLNAKFNKIEKTEQARLKKAISATSSSNPNLAVHSPNICSPSALCPGCDQVIYKIPKGIEYGFKNRYNNIWPYEHSRVKLSQPSPVPRGTGSGICEGTSPFCTHDEQDDYFNANYINYDEVSGYKYIATQNPLQATYEDFWKTIWSNKINVIVCLNKQLSANLAGQDLKYFDDQSFPKSSLQVQRVNTTDYEHYILREINLIRIKTGVAERVYHLEFKNWPDFGVPQSLDSILSLIDFKNKLVSEHHLNSQLLVHCSAGCGRTGCFITLDMILDCFKNKDGSKIDPWGEDDLIYKTVQFQRRQRISMVQNLDQFIVCYEVLLDYAVKQLKV